MDNLRMEQPGPLLTTHHHLLSSFASSSSDLLHRRHSHTNHSNSNNSSSSGSTNNYHNHNQAQINIPSPAPWLLTNNNWTVDTHHNQQHQSSSQQQQISVQNAQHPWEISDPILQLKHRSSGDESANTANGHSHSHGSSVFTQQADIPFACKLDDLDGRDVTFASLARSFDRVAEDLDNNSNANSNNVNSKSFSSFSVKAEAVDESSLSLKSSDGSGSGSGSSSLKKDQQLGGGGVTIASLEDGSIGLKLGKRTYYENSGVAPATPASVADEHASAKKTSNGSCNNNNNCNNGVSVSISAKNSTITTSSTSSPATAAPVAKKQKSSANATVPKCQAEGCKADLSGAKDYHRRHKVCEWHSKASKVKVANLEQRFCQQCSRFHVLSEFDEGKRSCRRRLAGHNERRRKPPPEPISLLSPGSFAYFADSRMNAALLDHPCFLQYRRAAAIMPPTPLSNTALTCHLGLVGGSLDESVGNGHSLELHHFMQGHHPNIKNAASSVGLLDESTRSYMMMGNAGAMALSQHQHHQQQQHHHHHHNHHQSGPSTTSPAPTSSTQISVIPDRQQHSEVAISGRALSLLSSSLSSPVNPCTMSVSLGMASPSMDQILVQDSHSIASSQHLAQSSCFSPNINISSAFQGLRHNSNHSLNSLTGSNSPDNMEQAGDRASLSSFDGRSMFLLPPESGFGSLQSSANSQHGRPILDLMQVSSTEQPTPGQQQTEVTYSDLHELSIFSRPTMI